MNDFFPKDYEIPSSPGKYMKLKEGNNKFRILTKAIVGLQMWVSEESTPQGMGGKPMRFRKKDPIMLGGDYIFKNGPDSFHSYVVWNYQENAIQTLTVTQMTIQTAIKALADDPDWGNPMNYDITISRKGKTMNDTSYSITPSPPTELAPEIKEAFERITINHDALYFTPENPFGTDVITYEETAPQKMTKPKEAPPSLTDATKDADDLPF